MQACFKAIVWCHQFSLGSGAGKTSLLEGRSGTAIDDDSTNSPSQEGLVHLIAASLFDLLDKKQATTGLPSANPHQVY